MYKIINTIARGKSVGYQFNKEGERITKLDIEKYGKKYSNKLSNLIKLYKLDEDKIYYRGINNCEHFFKENNIGFRTIYNKNMHKFVEYINSNFKEKEIIEKGYVSTTTSYDVAKSYCSDYNGLILKIKAKKGVHALHIESMSVYGNEKETLFDKGTKFVVDSAEIKEGKPIINVIAESD